MQKLMLTTAIVAVTSFGALAQTGDTAPDGMTPEPETSIESGPETAPEPGAGPDAAPEPGVAPDAAAEPGVAPDATGMPAADPAGGERSADRLMGADVYDAQGENIANVDDVLFDNDHAISQIVMDVGGFLGLGSHTVALDLADIDIMWSDEDGNVRVQVSMTQEQLEELPEYEG